MEFANYIIPFLSGGLAGSVLTIVYNKYVNRIQKMNCYLVENEIISKIPVERDAEIHKNIHYKEFHLKNTTNTDIKFFRIIFEFDADAKIIKQDTFCKSGKNRVKGRNLKSNEASFGIKNFNRKDVIKFYFDVANVTKNEFNITETESLGFKITTKDKRKYRKPIESIIVEKEILNASH